MSHKFSSPRERASRCSTDASSLACVSINIYAKWMHAMHSASCQKTSWSVGAGFSERKRKWWLDFLTQQDTRWPRHQLCATSERTSGDVIKLRINYVREKHALPAPPAHVLLGASERKRLCLLHRAPTMERWQQTATMRCWRTRHRQVFNALAFNL